MRIGIELPGKLKIPHRKGGEGRYYQDMMREKLRQYREGICLLLVGN